jgi:hypothetical protein
MTNITAPSPRKGKGESRGAMELEHVVIRDPELWSGSNKKPDARVFVQTNSARMPIDLTRLKPGQTVWMKWSGGPIVAKSKILSWHSGEFKDGNINEL